MDRHGDGVEIEIDDRCFCELLRLWLCFGWCKPLHVAEALGGRGVRDRHTAESVTNFRRTDKVGIGSEYSRTDVFLFHVANLAGECT